MKKTLGKFFTVIFALILLMPNFSVFAENISASWLGAYGYDYRGSGLPGAYGSRYGDYQWLSADGNVAYCIDLSVDNATGTQTNMGSDWTGVSQGDRNRIALAFLYGYDGHTKYGHDAQTEYVATQMIVHAIMGGYFNSGSESVFLNHAITKAPSISTVLSVYNAIKSQILSHHTRPSFTNSAVVTARTYSTSYSAITGLHTLTLTDTNGVLRYYNIAEKLVAAGINATVTGNTITISSAEPLDEVLISAERTRNTHVTVLLVGRIGYLYAPGLQSKVMVYGSRQSPDPVPAYFRLHSALDDIEIIKTDSENDEPIEGAIFDVYDDADNIIGTITTDENGYAVLPDQYYGNYIIKEKNPAEGYYQNETDYGYILDADAEPLDVTNDIIKGQIEITKKSNFDGRVLQNAKYGIYRASDDELMEEIVTDEFGVATSGLLRYGQYYLLEHEAPERYHLSTEKTMVFVGKDITMLTIETVVTDNPIIGRLKITYEPELPKIKIGEYLDTPQTGVDYYVSDSEILGYPVVPEDGSMQSIDSMIIIYLNPDDAPKEYANIYIACAFLAVMSLFIAWVGFGDRITAQKKKRG